jgi:hypothetical protein
MNTSRIARYCSIALISISTTSLAEKPEPPETSTGAYKFVGFSEEMMDGSGGLLKRYQACQATYGLGARMCTSKEIIETADLPSDLVGDAWVQPVFVPTSLDAVTDISGVTVQYYPTQFSCLSWRVINDSDRGLVVMSDVSFLTLPCSTERHVACCVPE